MYKPYFGFKERPFKLVPDPAYLYLGQSHEEALGHLNYAVRQGDGFVVITGEVGTGKTTVCRMFLEKLDENTETAYIFNPKLDSLQLLKAINDEFCIESSPDNTKDLIDILNRFLMEKKKLGKKAVLIIDESQNLSIEVLEQLRLLSNLETTKAKLLQIIMVGQPEFGEKLDSFELRQLEQRITLNCHLNPLTLKETGEYISHRIQIASHKNNDLFTKDAIKEIFRYSGGVPRKINIVCDRALLCAFSRDVKKINRNIALLAIQELSGKRDPRIGFFELNRKPLFLLAGLVLILVTLIVYPHVDLKESNAGPKHVEAVVHKILVPPAEEVMVAEQLDDTRNAAIEPGTETMDTHPAEERPVVTIGREDLKTLLQEPDAKHSRNTAMKIILDLWQAEAGLKSFLQEIEDHKEFFFLAAKQNHLSVQKIAGNLSLVKNLNHAAILELYIGNDPMPRFLTLVEMKNDDLIFEMEDRRVRIAANDILPFWKNRFYVIWKNIYGYTKEVQIEKNGNSVLMLKRHLQEIGYCDIVLNSVYDNSVKDAVKDVQKKYDLEIDGVVGPLTEIALYNENKSLVIPRLRKVL